MLITSINNSKVKEINKLNNKKYRDTSNKFIVEGKHLVEEAIKNNALIELILLEGVEFDFNGNITYVTSNVMKKISSMDSIPSMVGICKKKDNSIIGDKVLLLEDIQDPGNIGTIIRSATAFDIDTIILSNKCADVYSSKVIRSTEGMIFYSNILVMDLEETIKKLKSNNYIIYGTKVDNGSNIKDIDIPSKWALVMGNEGKGMSNTISNLCDNFLYIKMSNKVESLNVGVAASILLYEIYNK